MTRVLNLGCGRDLMAGAVNVDISPDVGADVVCDLSRRPWPFPDDSFDVIHAQDVIEHLPDTLAAFEEIHRVCAPGATVHVTVPHFSSANAYADPTHLRFFSHSTFDFFTETSEQPHYTRAAFRVRRRALVFEGRLLGRLVWKLANRSPRTYEKRFAWVYPALLVSAELEAVKH